MMQQSDLEQRRAMEVRFNGRTLHGYVAKFDSETQIGRYREIISPGAFRSSLKENSDIIALADHDPAQILGRTSSGTLELREDDVGLAFSLKVPNTSKGNDLIELAQRNDLGGMSFGFRVKKGGDKWKDDLRTLTDVELFEVSVVSSWPAYGETKVSLRSKPPRIYFLESNWLDTV